MPPRRKQPSRLPSYCYRDPKTGAYWMYVPDASRKTGRRREGFGQDLDRMLDAWSRSWGATEPRGDTVGVLLDVYLRNLATRRAEGEVSETTEADYRKRAESLRPVFGHVRIADVTVPMLVSWRDVRGKQRTTFNRERTVLSEAFKVGIERGLCMTNPVVHLKPKVETPRDRLPTDAEVNAVLAHCPRWLAGVVILAAATGLREGDILRLRKSDFGPDGLTVLPRKTRRKNPRPTRWAWSEGLRLACELVARESVVSSLLWLSKADGQPYTEDGFRTAWSRAIRAALAATPGLERFRFNDLRAKAGSESTDWRILGHLDQRTFERVYNRAPREVTPSR